MRNEDLTKRVYVFCVTGRSCSLSQHSEKINQQKLNRALRTPKYSSKLLLGQFLLITTSSHLVDLCICVWNLSMVTTYFISSIDFKAAVPLLKTSQGYVFCFFSQAQTTHFFQTLENILYNVAFILFKSKKYWFLWLFILILWAVQFPPGNPVLNWAI